MPPPSSSRSFSAKKGSSMRPSMEKVLRVGKKYSALAPARTPTTWVMQWRMDCRAVVQVKSTFFLMFCAHPSTTVLEGWGGGRYEKREANREARQAAVWTGAAGSVLPGPQ